MNPTLLITLSFLFFSLTTYFPLVFTAYVYDSDGTPLAPGKYEYYISQTTTSGQEGGGLMLGSGSGENQTCPLTVLQEFCEDHDGIPVTFNVLDGGFIIYEDLSNVEIEFVLNSKQQKCAKSSKWVLVQNYLLFDTKWISIGSFEDQRASDTPEIVNGVFKIKKQGSGYKFVFFSEESKSYFDIKRYNDFNGRRLVAVDFESGKYHPFEVEFVARRFRSSVV